MYGVFEYLAWKKTQEFVKLNKTLQQQESQFLLCCSKAFSHYVCNEFKERLVDLNVMYNQLFAVYFNKSYV